VIARPATIDELAEAVRTAPPGTLTIRGGSSKAPPIRDGLVLDLPALTGIVAYDPAECVVAARAGTPVRDLQTALAAHGQYLPFDPPLSRAGATIGGTVALGISGSRRLRYGGVRDFVIGARVVDGEGRVIHSGGHVVKNAAGFLLHHGLVGSAGRFGVIGEVAFKVFPAPAAAITLRLPCPSVAAALEAHERLRLAVADLDALDVDLATPTVWVRVAGAASALPAAVAVARAALGADAPELLEGEADQAVWADAGEYVWAAGHRLLVKIATTPSRLAGLPAAVAALGPARAIAAGAAVLLATDAPPVDVEAALPPGVRAIVVRGETCGRALGARHDAVFARRVRRTLDPAGRFA
jgi:glycolate oxidase FAD binding subunit